MSISTYYNKIIEYRDLHNSVLNTWANHLIVVFAFFIPLSMSGRQSTLFLIFFLFLLRGNCLGYIKEGLKDKLVRAFAIYFLVHVVWLLGTDNFIHAQKIVHEAKFLLYPLLFIILIDKKFIPRIFAAFILGMLISEIWSLGIYFEVLPYNLHDGWQGISRLPTPVHHHTNYGYMLSITAAILLQKLLSEKNPSWMKVSISTFFIVTAVVIFINASRTGYILFPILIMILFYLYYKNRSIVAVTSALVFIVLVLVYNVSGIFHDRLDQTISSISSMYFEGKYNTSLGTRVAIFLGSKDLIFNNLLIGVGTGDQMDEVKSHLKAVNQEILLLAETVVHLHNEYFRAILQFGIVGLLSFLYIIYQLFRYPQEEVNKKNTQIILGVAILFFSFVEIFVHGQGALLTTVLLVGVTLRNYSVNNTDFSPLKKMSFLKYGTAATLIELISRYT